MNEYIAEIIYSQYGEATVFKEKLIRCRDCLKRKKNGFCLHWNRYAKNDDGHCDGAQRKEE